jgi:hypothetical protein
MFNFEKLEVWQEAVQFADLIYSLTRTFPQEEVAHRRSAATLRRELASARRRSLIRDVGVDLFLENLERERTIP